MHSIFSKALRAVAGLSLALLAPTVSTLSAQSVTSTMQGGGVWIVSWGDGTTSCTTLKTAPAISTCDLPWSFAHPRNVLAQVDGSGSSLSFLLPYVHALPENYLAPPPGAWPCCGWRGLTLSNFAGQWSQASGASGGALQLSLISSMAVSNYTGPISEWGGIPLQDLGFLKFTATLTPDATGKVLSGVFQFTLTDLKGVALYQGTGAITMSRAI